MIKAIRLVTEKMDKSENQEYDYCEFEDDGMEDDGEADNENQDDTEASEMSRDFVNLLEKNFKNKSLRCFAHTLQLVVKNGINI